MEQVCQRWYPEVLEEAQRGELQKQWIFFPPEIKHIKKMEYFSWIPSTSAKIMGQLSLKPSWQH